MAQVPTTYACLARASTDRYCTQGNAKTTIYHCQSSIDLVETLTGSQSVCWVEHSFRCLRPVDLIQPFGTLGCPFEVA